MLGAKELNGDLSLSCLGEVGLPWQSGQMGDDAQAVKAMVGGVLALEQPLIPST